MKKSKIILTNNVLILENIFMREELCRLEKKHDNLLVEIDVNRQSNAYESQSQTENLHGHISERLEAVEVLTQKKQLKEENASLQEEIKILKDPHS